MIKTEYDHIAPYVTKDQTLIRELLHPAVHGEGRTSLAEAVLAPGLVSELHLHEATEEIYHYTQGSGVMTLGVEKLDVRRGSTVLIPPGTPHQVENTGDGDMRILCICSPPYSHEDTKLLQRTP
ncbi:Cupin 2 conserved barrel domain protein [Desulfatibacillum aliphaticivorans]|uniref:Cupin 2 conserved barrel domain protein n=1 Tax=Desulfatibacillum aliphaticivorans TaxID=218208 RepID=B8FCV7_DESAL|nr:cupin domain-containing protein [Desulfatibacillum aliphaticivorans]ACL06388.1 Cupin 2 conserved barrel domain protein [Desulfatibacillum aliphaticivorans]